MIKSLDISKIDIIMRIWIEENIRTHDFISKDYWNGNYEYVKEIIPLADVFVYEEDDVIKGFIGIVDNSYIAGLFVSKAYQSEGIGSKLIKVSKQKYPSLKLDVYSKNVKAISFYKKHGFIIEGEKENEETIEKEYSMTWKS